ncbi:MAG: hypothetical protein JXR59_08835 [Desulfuromonadaceae bacterium]|nr:hypothetical protein [Desulfuromonadaceae bacterium]
MPPSTVRRLCTVLLAVAMLLSTLPVHAATFTPHIEEYAQGWIDWDQGLIYGTGRVPLDDKGSSKIKALHAAELVAAGNIVKLASGIHLDDRQTMERLGNGNFSVKLTAFLRYRDHQRQMVTNVHNPYAEVTLVAPITGVQGLTAQLLRYLHGKPLQWQKFPLPDPQHQRAEQADDPWLVIDARQLPAFAQVKPSLFPKLLTTSGQKVYDVDRVYQSALSSRGMARYVHSTASAQQLILSEASPPRSWWQALSFVSPAWAAVRQQRPRYIVATAQKTSGIARTNLIISTVDANRLRAEDDASEILRQCRVIIVTSAPAGGVEGMRSDQRPLHL